MIYLKIKSLKLFNHNKNNIIRNIDSFENNSELNNQINIYSKQGTEKYIPEKNYYSILLIIFNYLIIIINSITDYE